MDILVTGGTGFVGKALVDQIILRGHAPQVVSRSPITKSQRKLIAVPTAGQLFSSELIGKVSKVVNWR